MATYLVDNSVWQKAGRSEPIATRLRSLMTQHLIVTCPPQVFEYCHSACSPAEYRELRQDMEQFLSASVVPDEEIALDVQQSLWDMGYARAAGALDVLIAAYAIVNEAVLLNSDHDFEYIERATGLLRQEYVPE